MLAISVIRQKDAINELALFWKSIFLVSSLHNIHFRPLLKVQSSTSKGALAESVGFDPTDLPYNSRRVQDEKSFNRDIFASVDMKGMLECFREMLRL